MSWLDELKVGDEVVACTHDSFRKIHTVDRVTNTLIYISGVTFPYKRSKGEWTNDVYGKNRLEECTKEARKKIDEQEERAAILLFLRREFYDGISRVSIRNLRKIRDCVNESLPKGRRL